jgi:hypothetical protein
MLTPKTHCSALDAVIHELEGEYFSLFMLELIAAMLSISILHCALRHGLRATAVCACCASQALCFTVLS